ncbi:MAG: uracil-DNA glycosylase [Proteobacteria bacterium]|nr:uracil-DNA glycosylase [Pseudomonadota bacterium]MDA1332243.1 uracil-DNA glycosylase [Pseudomonadota bacterium]
MPIKKKSFSLGCRKCPRLVSFLNQVRGDCPDYFALPVPSFGDPNARLLIVGLAPGMHGSNRTGRPFTGDHAGVLLYQTIYDSGFSTRSVSESKSDDLELKDCRITNAVRCLPPQNKPIGSEVNNCNTFLLEELEQVPKGGIIIALGSVAHSAVLKALNLKKSLYPFGHESIHDLNFNLRMIDSYHCSRYNTQTRRLTHEMFRSVFLKARELLDRK